MIQSRFTLYPGWGRGEQRKEAWTLLRESSFCFSTPDTSLLQQLVGNIQEYPRIDWGMEVSELYLRRTPDFGSHFRFFPQSPILIQRDVQTDSGWNKQFFYPKDEVSDQYLTETLRRKLIAAGKGDLSVQVRFDRSYARIRTKAATYRGITSRGSICPVIVEGDPKAVAFAWEVGVGNSTGIGWGALG